MRRAVLMSAAAAVAVVSGWTAWQFQTGVVQAHNEDRPRFEVDADWPKPLPNNWIVGQVAGIAVDRHDHIWIIQRPNSLTDDEAGAEPRFPINPATTATRTAARSDCCKAAPSVMKFNRRGDLLAAWGGPADPGFLTKRCVAIPGTTQANSCDWPNNEHGIYVDHNDYVYVAGNGGANNQVLKFTADGTFVYQIGNPGAFAGGRSNDTKGDRNGRPLLGQPADTEVDPLTNELYIADGYQNKRVLVVDAADGKYKRHWGAFGNVPSDAAPLPYNPGVIDTQFRNPVHCVRVANDGLVYVCDRVNNRYHVFTKAGKFVDEVLLDRDTLGNGAMWDIDFSPDRRQKYLYNADGENNRLVVFNRSSGDVIAKVSRNGRSAGQFHWVHNLAVDSRGNIYTAEVDTGKRAQKFKPVKDDD
jgi:DNA-binding beta-propeller fold protein YncE